MQCSLPEVVFFIILLENYEHSDLLPKVINRRLTACSRFRSCLEWIRQGTLMIKMDKK